MSKAFITYVTLWLKLETMYLPLKEATDDKSMTQKYI